MHPARVEGRGERWFRTSFKKAGSEAGAGPLLGVMLDVTEARHDEMQWRQIESWLVTLSETLPFDLWICDPEGRCVLQNSSSRRRVGNMLGRSSPAWEPSLRRALHGEPSREEIDAELDGAFRHYVRVVAPARRDDGILAVLGVEMDVTDLKRTEERLRRSLADLGEAQDALVRKKQLAALGEMSASVAHEIRNPLGAISNAVALLRRRAPRESGGEGLCRIIEEEVERLARLVANLLDSVRPMRANLSPTPLGSVVEDALAQSLRSEGHEERVRIHRVVDPTLPAVPMDGHLLTMALTNVFRNALQAMPSGGELFVVIDREEGTEGSWGRLSIRDSGPGLSREVQERIFEPFVTTRPTGSGLGLTIVRRIVEEHRGKIAIASEPGQGTTCVIRLPLPGAAP